MKKQSITIFASLMFIFIIATSCGNNKKDNAIMEKYTKIAEQENELLPLSMGNNILFDKVEALEGNIYKYYYTFLEDPTPTPEYFIEHSKPRIISILKDSPDMNEMRKDRMTLVYCYKKSDNSVYAEVMISPDEY